MDYDKLDEILSTIDYKSKEYLSPIIEIIGEIKKCLIAEQTSYSHLMLRENYFGLVQKIIEFEHELMIKFSFNSLQRFFNDEVKCELCSSKEKSQFLANILRYIQHTHINNDITKLEIFRFLLNNHDTIESVLNPKILNSLIEISINEWHNENKMIQASSKTLITKYIAIICNQISSNSKKSTSQDNPLDLLVLSAFNSLLTLFNQEFRTNDLRCFSLECLELLLNNLIENKKTFNICESQAFMEFSWQTLCPSILFQFGESGLGVTTTKAPTPTSSNASTSTPLPGGIPTGIHFKQVYKILILLTALIGGCKSMIPVFEAIYQRVLFYTPEDDRLLILKLFKTHVNREFLESLVSQTEASMRLNVDMDNHRTTTNNKNDFNEFTIINL